MPRGGRRGATLLPMVDASIFLGMLLSLRSFAKGNRLAGGLWFLASLVASALLLMHHMTDSLAINL